MPRDVFLNHDITELTPKRVHGKHQRGIIISDGSDDSPDVPELSSQELPLRISPTKTPVTKLSVAKPAMSTPRKYLKHPEIIEISSSSDEDDRERTKEPMTPTLSDFDKKHSRTRSIVKPINDITTKTRRKFIEISSSDDDLPPSKPAMKPESASPTKRKQSERIPDSPIVPNKLDIRVTGDGVVEYVPLPKKPILLTPKTNETKKPSINMFKPIERRRTLLQPDVEEDLSWEFEQNETGEIRSGAILVNSQGDEEHINESISLHGPHIPEHGLGTSSKEMPSGTSSSPSKTPRKKKMPEAVANLHRMAIPFLKLLDSVVFDNQLGASHLPDLDPPPPSVGKGKKRGQSGTIYGMGTRGEYNDGHDSFIELSWSNRMATTAGRTEYKKTATKQIIIKIELSVKVITTRERLRSTLAHEGCHAACWAISGDFKSPHGTTFKRWAAKVMKAFPDVEVTTKHDYEIDFKYQWKCIGPNCGQIYKRHSNSINIQRQGCHCGSRLQPQFTLPTKQTRTKSAEDSPSKSAALGTTPQRATPKLLKTGQDAEIFGSGDDESEGDISILPIGRYKQPKPRDESDSSLEDLTLSLGGARI